MYLLLKPNVRKKVTKVLWLQITKVRSSRSCRRNKARSNPPHNYRSSLAGNVNCERHEHLTLENYKTQKFCEIEKKMIIFQNLRVKLAIAGGTFYAN